MSPRSVHRRRSPRTTRVLTYPRDPNPYQHLLHDALAGEGVPAEFVPERTGSALLNLMLLPAELFRERLRGARILHLHWVFKFVPEWAAGVPGGRRLGYAWFRAVLAVAHVLGYRLVWTAHNLVPHAQVFPDDRAARRTLAAAATAVIVHGAQVGTRLTQEFGLDPERITVVPHGPFSPAPGAPSRSEARADLGVSEQDVLIGLVGRIDPYKGADDLLEAVARLDDAGQLPEGLRILVAGSCSDADLTSELERLAAGRDRVILRLGWLTEEAYSGLTGALDLAVLPFRRITTSGSAVAALSCGVPLAVPVGLLPDLPEDCVIRFDDVGELVQGVGRGAHDLGNPGAAARRRVDDWTWADVATATTDVYRRSLAATRRTTSGGTHARLSDPGA